MQWMVIAIFAVAFAIASFAGAAQQSDTDAAELVLDGPVELEVDRDKVELVLDGVIVARNPADSIALVRRAGARRARPLRIGHTYDGYVLIEVTRTSVLMAGVGRDLRLTLPGREAQNVANDERNVSRQSAAAESPSVQPVAEPEAVWLRRSFSRAEASRRLEKEIPVILSDTELTPRVVEGEVRGLELIRLPDGTVLSESGLLPGDVLKSLNGEPLRGLDALWELLARFSEDDELRLVVERRGEVMRFAYALTN